MEDLISRLDLRRDSDEFDLKALRALSAAPAIVKEAVVDHVKFAGGADVECALLFLFACYILFSRRTLLLDFVLTFVGSTSAFTRIRLSRPRSWRLWRVLALAVFVLVRPAPLVNSLISIGNSAKRLAGITLKIWCACCLCGFEVGLLLLRLLVVGWITRGIALLTA